MGSGHRLACTRISHRTRLVPDSHSIRTVVRCKSMASSVQKPRIFTIGHSTRPIAEFIAILDANKLKQVVDVRTIPKSRHNPQFGGKRLAKSLGRHGIRYIHILGLGGLRHTRKDSPNKAWRNSSFRGYADYMQTDEFDKYLRQLIALSKRRRLTIMCAEAVPWRCHRSLIADALLAHGLNVSDLFGMGLARPHKMTSFAKVKGTHVSYPNV